MERLDDYIKERIRGAGGRGMGLVSKGDRLYRPSGRMILRVACSGFSKVEGGVAF